MAATRGELHGASAAGRTRLKRRSSSADARAAPNAPKPGGFGTPAERSPSATRTVTGLAGATPNATPRQTRSRSAVPPTTTAGLRSRGARTRNRQRVGAGAEPNRTALAKPKASPAKLCIPERDTEANDADLKSTPLGLPALVWTGNCIDGKADGHGHAVWCYPTEQLYSVRPRTPNRLKVNWVCPD